MGSLAGYNHPRCRKTVRCDLATKQQQQIVINIGVELEARDFLADILSEAFSVCVVVVGKTLSQIVCSLWGHKFNPWKAGAVGCCAKCWAHNAKCPEDSQLPSASSCTLKCSEYCLAGPAWTCSSSAACRRRIHGSCCGPICTILANQSSVAMRSLKAVAFSPFLLTASLRPQTSLGCFCLDWFI